MLSPEARVKEYLSLMALMATVHNLSQSPLFIRSLTIESNFYLGSVSAFMALSQTLLRVLSLKLGRASMLI